MTLKQIKTDEEAIEGRDYLVKVKKKGIVEPLFWTVGTFHNGTLILDDEYSDSKRLAFYEIPQ